LKNHPCGDVTKLAAMALYGAYRPAAENPTMLSWSTW